MEQDNVRDKDFKEKATQFLQAYGLFVVAGLCVICLGIALAVSYWPRPGEEAPAQEAPPSTEQANLDEAQGEAVLPMPSESSEPAQAIAPALTDAPTASKAPEKTAEAKTVSANKAPAPIEGAIIWGYAVDSLIYSKTLEQWTTHEGIDISAKMGGEVRAVMPGEVKRVYEDDQLGSVVMIDHDGGLTSLYGNLAEKPPVTEGQSVKAGDTIGSIGATAVSECALESHLHFAMIKDGKSVDPEKYVLLAK